MLQLDFLVLFFCVFFKNFATTLFYYYYNKKIVSILSLQMKTILTKFWLSTELNINNRQS